MLSDPKYQRLNAGERSCWVTLLCLGSMDNGVVKHCEEQYLISHSGIDIMEIGKYHGVLVKFEMLGLITRRRDDVGLEYIQIKNWGKRQEVYSESRDRVRKWRAKQLDVTPVTLLGNAREEENRIDKRRGEKEIPPHKHKKYLLEIPESDLNALREKYEASTSQIKRKAEQMHNYCEAKGRVYKNYRAFLENGLDKDFGRRAKVATQNKEPERVLTAEEKEIVEKKMAQINAMFRVVDKPIV